MKTFTELAEWCNGAAQQFDDPAEPVCQMFFEWRQGLEAFRGEKLACGMMAGDFVLVLGPGFPVLPVPVRAGAPLIRRHPEVELQAYGAELIAPGVWSLEPSLNVEGLIHGFVVLYGVPDPAPWGEERRILLP